ncbi:unnamed protein product [Polarella glacialis]|uniref:Uncharacterized protein n=1 Tax=Polarella glacialis TaxID=89957 RepID=A0A813IVX9_POLGL|nr:unnamed protein product [Polarella glacialis]
MAKAPDASKALGDSGLRATLGALTSLLISGAQGNRSSSPEPRHLANVARRSATAVVRGTASLSRLCAELSPAPPQAKPQEASNGERGPARPTAVGEVLFSMIAACATRAHR